MSRGVCASDFRAVCLGSLQWRNPPLGLRAAAPYRGAQSRPNDGETGHLTSSGEHIRGRCQEGQSLPQSAPLVHQIFQLLGSGELLQLAGARPWE